MPLPAGTRLGAYEILTPLGVGGMGEVYRATDTRLDRAVAIKVLPDLFAHDPDRLARFDREAKTLAALNHPNIAQIYGLEAGALVMELVEGPTLQELMATATPGLPLDQALPIARQIADALECAHEAGIVHRDLKPANIKVRDDGTVKVLDFGLAKALSPEGTSAPDVMNSPTLTNRATALGVILGTAAYMSPEQAKGKPVDRRTDVWAFGVVLYEMLTGRRLFDGEDISDTLAAVLTREPAWTDLPASTPPSIRRLLARCLVRDRRARLDSMASARFEIEETLGITGRSRIASEASIATLGQPDSVATAPQRPFRRAARPLMLVMAGVAAVAGAVGWLLATSFAGTIAGGDTPAPTIVSSVLAPPDALSAFHRGFALSPDGRILVVSARSPTGVRALWKRDLAQPTFTRMAGTEDAVHPFWSADSRQVGFFTVDAMKRVPVEGGPAQTICQVTGVRRASWNRFDEILLSLGRGAQAGIFKVPAAGGVPEKLALDGNVFLPQWLPGGRSFVFVHVEQDVVQLRAAPLDSSRPPVKVLDLELRDPGALLSPSGIVFFNRAGVLTGQRLDVEALQPTGPAVAIGPAVGTPLAWFAATASADSLMLLSGDIAVTGGNPGDPISRLRWVNRQGQAIGDLSEPGRYWTHALSPDGMRAVVNPDKDLWVIDATTKMRTRITAGPYTYSGAIWSPDGSRLMYREQGGVWVRPLDGRTPATQILEPPTPFPVHWSSDGTSVLLTARTAGTSSSVDIFLFKIGDTRPRPFVATEFHEWSPRFSPSGRWVAYVSDITGRPEVYLQPVDESGAAVRISSEGGEHPHWARDGRELVYITPTDEFVAVDLSRFEETRTPGGQQKLFRMVVNDLIRSNYSPFDVAPDGQRFLLNVPEPSEPLTFIQGIDALFATRR